METGSNANMDKGKTIAYTNDENAIGDQQTKMLEEYFESCPHPSKNQRLQLSKDLGIDLDDIKHWFQNKRAEMQAEKEIVTNIALKAENWRLFRENLEVKQALKNINCEASGLNILEVENACLKKEIARVHGMIYDHIKEERRKRVAARKLAPQQEQQRRWLNETSQLTKTQDNREF